MVLLQLCRLCSREQQAWNHHLLKITSPFLEDPLRFSQASLKFFMKIFVINISRKYKFLDPDFFFSSKLQYIFNFYWPVCCNMILNYGPIIITFAWNSCLGFNLFTCSQTIKLTWCYSWKYRLKWPYTYLNINPVKHVRCIIFEVFKTFTSSRFFFKKP